MIEFVDTDRAYFVCPDDACDLFFKSDCHIPCDHECPRESEMRKVIVCHLCKKPIELPGDHFSWQRVDCECGASNFQRMSGKYTLVRG